LDIGEELMEHSEGTLEGVGGLNLHLQSWRSGGDSVAALALVHGLGEHSGRYQNLVDYLVPRGYAVYGFDLRGHGRSPGPRGYINSWEELRGDVGSFLRYVNRAEGTSGDRPLFLMGHSFGGLIALEFALYGGHLTPLLNGVVASAPGLSTEGFSPLLLLIARVLSRLQPALAIKTGLDSTGLSRDPAVVQAYQQDPLVHGVGTPRLTTESMAAIQRTFASVAGWKLPLLMFYGTDDRIVPSGAGRRFFEQVPIEDKQLIEYEDGFHESHNDVEYERVLADLEQWLSHHCG
jgi:alpha-beta hydrolase superfamily lysophospholipase